MVTINENQFRFFYSGTKEEFIAAGRNTLADEKGLMVFIKDVAHNGAGSCIYMAGMFFADFATLIATTLGALRYFKGIQGSGESLYQAPLGGGYLAIQSANTAQVTVTIDVDGVKIDLAQAFVTKLNNVVQQSQTIFNDYLKAADKANLIEAINTTKQEAIAEVVGTDEDTSASDTVKGAKKYADEKIASTGGNIESLTERVTTLEGNDAGSSVRTIVQDEVAKQLTSENISDSFDTLKEIAEWLSSHPDDVTAINNAIAANTQAIQILNGDGVGSVNKKIADAIAAEVQRADNAYDAKGAAAQALEDAKKYADGKTVDLSGYYTKEQVNAMFVIGTLD